MKDDNKEGTVNTEPKAITLDEARKNPEFEKQLASLVDSATTKAIATYKDKGFKSAVDEAVTARQKALETKTPDQIRIEEAEAKLEAMQATIADKERLEMRNSNKDVGRSAFKKAGLPDSLLDFFVTDNSESSKENIAKAIEALEGFKTTIKQELLGGNNITVPGKTKQTGDGTAKEPGPGATREQYMAWWKSQGK